jgi:hypothetical protein
MYVRQGGVSLHVWKAPLDVVMVSGVKQTLRLDAICEPAPAFASWIFLNRDLTKKLLTEELKQASH